MKLMDAVETNKYELVKSILDQNSDISTGELSVALAISVRCEDLNIIQLLIDHGADVNHISLDVMPILHQAVEEDRPDVIQLLVQNSADVNIRNDLGNTALIIALDIEIVTASEWIDPPEMEISKLLFELGADPTIKNDRGQSAIDICRERNYEEALELFTKKNQ